jgi:DNA-binding GntR family transcriptional regulator
MPRLARSLGDQIANTLRGEILSGRLAPGEALQEVELAARFGVSRGPVRDAILELTKEGILTPRRSRGVSVASSAPDSIQAFVLPLRRTIECYALGLFFPTVGNEHFRVWDEILEELRRACLAGDEAMIAEQDIALHRSILEMSGQHDLLAIWSTIVARIRRYFIEGCRRFDDPMIHYQQHCELIDTFRERDLNTALRALEAHIA